MTRSCSNARAERLVDEFDEASALNSGGFSVRHGIAALLILRVGISVLNCHYNVPNQSAMIERAHDALAEPEPEGPTDEELMALAVEVFENPCATDKDYARAVLARWGK